MVNVIFIGSIVIIALYLMVILISFDPSDPSWLQTDWSGSIHNWGGIIGAQCSDFLFFIFGMLAYIIPICISLYMWKIYMQQACITIFMIILEIIGILLLLSICCGIIHHIFINDIFYFSSGGVIGYTLCDWISSYVLYKYHINIILYAMSVVSVILIFSRFFINFIIKIKKQKLLNSIGILKKYFYKNKKILYKSMCCTLYDQVRINPTIFFVKQDDHLQKSIHKCIKTEPLPFISLHTKNVAQELYSHTHTEKSYALKNHINDYNHSKLNDVILHHAKHSNFSINNNYKKNDFKKTDYLKKKNSFNLSSRYNKKLYNNEALCVLKNKNYKNNNLLNKNYGLMNVIKQKDTAQKTVSINKHINQPCSSVLNKMHNSTMHHDVNYAINNIVFPDISLLMESDTKNNINTIELQNISQLLEKKLAEYRVLTNVANIIPGPIMTRFELNLSPGTKSSKIVNLSRDLARSLSVTSVRVVEVIPGTPYVGLEVPNRKRNMVYLRDIIDSVQFKKINTPLPLALGKDISGNPIVEDLRNMPHLLVAGTTGSGKSVGINAMIISILYKATPDEVRFIMIDPKILELSIYSNIPHILKHVITEIQDIDKTLQWCVQEMERRYQLMAEIGVRNLEHYNYNVEQLYSKKYVMNNFLNKSNKNTITHSNLKLKKLPYIIIIVDEFSDLMIMSAKKIEELIIRLTQKARAAGIHLILATQRPSVNVITGLIKANIPTRIAFTVSSKVDSHTIIGQSGAESLLGMGDMLYLAANSSIPVRVHGARVVDQEVRAVVNFLEAQKSSMVTKNRL